MTTQTGIVKWFDDGKGFGFITPDGGGKDLFAHFSEIQSTGGFRSLAEGQKVEFEVKQGQKGPQAATIKAIEEDPGLPCKKRSPGCVFLCPRGVHSGGNSACASSGAAVSLGATNGAIPPGSGQAMAMWLSSQRMLRSQSLA